MGKLSALFLLLSLAACSENLESCLESAAKMPAANGVTLAASQCRKRFPQAKFDDSEFRAAAPAASASR